MFTVSVNGGCSIRLGAADKLSNKLRRIECERLFYFIRLYF